MNERQAIVDRRAKAKVDLRWEQVDMLLLLGSFLAEVMLLRSCGDIVCVMVNATERKGKGRMGDRFLLFRVFFRLLI